MDHRARYARCMKNLQKFFVISCGASIALCGNLAAVPKLNLGISNFLDGGPLRPEPGWYWYEVLNYYHTNRFFDGAGNLIPQSPELDSATIITQFVYQGKREMLYAHPGIAAGFSMYPHSSISANPLGLTSSGMGIGDFGIGIFLQFKPIMHNGRGILVQRLEVDANFPVGKFCRNFTLNPGNGVFYINPYWAATLFFTPHWAISWRLNYNWSSVNKKNGIQFGDVIYLIHTMEFEAAPQFWIGCNGYVLKELKNSRLNGVPIPNSRQQVCGIGPGMLYSPSSKTHLFANLYFEYKARARPAGISVIFKLLYQF